MTKFSMSLNKAQQYQNYTLFDSTINNQLECGSGQATEFLYQSMQQTL